MQRDKELILLVGSNVRRLRRRAGITGREAAERGGLDVRKWWRIEASRYNITMDTLAAVCVGLGVDAEELFQPLPKGS